MNVQTKDIMNRIRNKPPSFNRNSNKLFLIVLHNTLYIQMKIQMDWIVGINIFDLFDYIIDNRLLLGVNSKNRFRLRKGTCLTFQISSENSITIARSNYFICYNISLRLHRDHYWVLRGVASSGCFPSFALHKRG